VGKPGYPGGLIIMLQRFCSLAVGTMRNPQSGGSKSLQHGLAEKKIHPPLLNLLQESGLRKRRLESRN